MRKYDLPWGKDMIPDAMPWIVETCARDGRYNTDDLKAHLTTLLKVKVDVVMEGDENRSAWSNYVDWLTQFLTASGLHTRLAPKTYAITPLGQDLAQALKSGTLAADGREIHAWVRDRNPVATRAGTLKGKSPRRGRNSDPSPTVRDGSISTKEPEDV